MSRVAPQRSFAACRVIVVLLSGAAACGTSPAAPEGDGGTFVAMGPDFQGFSSWTTQTIQNPVPGGSTHVAGARSIYINMLPPEGATEFPVGTMIVKRTEADGKIFARAKRGGSFNSKGAAGWEWFELVESAGTVVVKWRGLGPPLGETYGGDPNAGCNMCHKLAASNDYVLAPGLMLAPATTPDASDDAVGPPQDGGTEAAADDAQAD
jgi:hypothetical protein